MDIYGEQAGLAPITIDFSLQPIRGESGEVEYLLSGWPTTSPNSRGRATCSAVSPGHNKRWLDYTGLSIEEMKTSCESTEVRTEGRLTLVEGLRCQTKGSGGSVGRRFGAATEPFATGDLAAWSEIEPRAEVFFCGPATRVESNLTDDRQSGVGFDAINFGEINARDAVKVAAGIEGNPAAPPPAGAGSEGRLRAPDLELLEADLDLGVAGGNLAMIKRDEFEGLLESKKMLFAVVPFKGASDSGLGAVTAREAQFGQFDRIALPAKDGLYDPHPVTPGCR